MKIIHTSDWHLGQRLYNYDRADEEARFFAQLADLVARERPDALVVSGDVFHTGAPGNDVAKSFTDSLLDVSARSPGLETVVIAGNHDSYSRLMVDAALWKRCRVHVFGVPAEDADGRAAFEGNVVELPGKGVIAAVPFCHARNFPQVPGAEGTDRAAAYFAGLGRHLAERNAANLPCVLMAHLAVGKETSFTGQDRLGVIGGEECIDPETLGTGYDYIALGHIHCPQWIRGEWKRARYCGTPRAIHFDETYAHGVDVVTVERGQPPAVRTEVFPPLRALKTFGGAAGAPFDDALGQMQAAADLPAETYVRLNVSIGANDMPGADWTERARQAAADRGLRFCQVNPIRQAAVDVNAHATPALTVDELRELSPDKVIDILARQHALTDRQRALLKGLLEGEME